jgi:hypothetical protein
MFGPLGQIVMLIGLTSGLRALGRLVGPRRSGLLMGLPSTTALVLLGCGLERGLDEATVAAEACLGGLVAAATLPLAFGHAVEAGWRLPRAVGAAVLGYLLVALGLWWLPGLGAARCVAAATLGVVVVCRLARRHRRDNEVESEPPPPAGTAGARIRLIATRGGVPTIYVVVIRTLRWLAGPSWSGRFITFPGGSLALLIATHVEAGPATSRRLAAAMPTGSLATLAFLAVFRFAGPVIGLGWGTVVAYMAALTALVTIDSVIGPCRPAAGDAVRRSAHWIAVRMPRSGRVGFLRADAAAWGWFVRQRRPASVRQFAPRLECLAG